MLTLRRPSTGRHASRDEVLHHSSHDAVSSCAFCAVHGFVGGIKERNHVGMFHVEIGNTDADCIGRHFFDNRLCNATTDALCDRKPRINASLRKKDDKFFSTIPSDNILH